MDVAERLAAMERRLDELTTTNAELATTNERLAEEREKYRALYNELLAKARKLELGILGQKSERQSADEAQLSMQVLAGLLGERAPELEASSDSEPAAEPPASPPTKPRPGRGGRRLVPDDLPLVEIELVPDDVEDEGVENFEKIGEEVISTIERRPASFVHVRVKRGKYVRKNRDRSELTEVSTATPLELPIERGLAGPGLMAETIVRRFADSLPLHRQQKIFAREGLELAKSTICGWHKTLTELCRLLLGAMWKDAIDNAEYLCTDATGVLVRNNDKCRTGHFWVVIAPTRHVLFRYSPKHNGAAVDAMLAEYRGVLVADAHVVFDHLYADGEVIEAGCWAHTRRYFFKALSADPEAAKEALAFIGGLFAIERKLENLTPKRRKAERKKRSAPIVDAFFEWCDQLALTVLDDTPIAKGVRYARNQREALQTFLADGRIPIHNNGSERELRREAVGRKNWLFVGNDEAGEVNATFVSLIASCEMHGLEPWAYLRDLFCLLPQWPQARVLQLSPLHWRETLRQEDTQQLLTDNVLRRVTLGEFDEQLGLG